MFDKDHPHIEVPVELPPQPPHPAGRVSRGLRTGCLANLAVAIVLGLMSPSTSWRDALIVFALGPSVVTVALAAMHYRKGETETVKGYALALSIALLLSSPCWGNGLS